MLEKVFSRKLMVTMTAVLSALTQPNLSNVQLVVIGVVSCVYVIAEALVDRGAVDTGAIDRIVDGVARATSQPPVEKQP